MAIGYWDINNSQGYIHIPSVDSGSGEIYNPYICSGDSYTITLKDGNNTKILEQEYTPNTSDCDACKIVGIFIERYGGADIAGISDFAPNNVKTRVIDCVSSLKRSDEAISANTFLFRREFDFSKYRVNNYGNITSSTSYVGNNSYNKNGISLSFGGSGHFVEYGLSTDSAETFTICESSELMQLGIGGCIDAIKSSAFTENDFLEYVHLVGTDLRSIGDYAFYHLGNNVNYSVIRYNSLYNLGKIGQAAFKYNGGMLIFKPIDSSYDSFSGINLSDIQTSLSIYEAAFEGANPTNTLDLYGNGKTDGYAVILPNNISYVGGNAFANTYINNLTIPESSPSSIFNTGSFSPNYIKYLHVPSGCKSNYSQFAMNFNIDKDNIIDDA